MLHRLGPPRRRATLELVTDGQIDSATVAVLSLDFDVRYERKNGAAPNAVVLVATRRNYRDSLHALRSRTDAPTVLLLDESDPAERVRALEAGADDILNAPFDPSELLARLRALLRRTGRPTSEKFAIDDLDVDVARRIVRRGDRIIELSPVELTLLTVLARHEGAVVPHGMLTREVWGSDKSKNTVHTFVSYLRAKLNAAGETPLIHTIRGVGYALRPTEGIQPANNDCASTA